MFPNVSLGTHKKAINAVISVFMAFLVEHSLYVILCMFLKSQCQQWLERVFVLAVFVTMLHRILHILNVVNPHKSDETPYRHIVAPPKIE